MAINEGQRGRKESHEEFRKTAREESAEIGKFYRFARTDANFFDKNKNLSELANGFRESKFDLYVDFLTRVTSDVIQPAAPQKRGEKLTNILNIADSMGVPKGHVVVICVLSALYGNRASIKILNPRNVTNKAYNALNDLMVISRICQFQACDVPRSIDFKFVTMDEYLKDFLKCVSDFRGEAVAAPSTETAQHSVRYNVNEKLFPSMTEEEFLDLQTCLEGEPVL